MKTIMLFLFRIATYYIKKSANFSAYDDCYEAHIRMGENAPGFHAEHFVYYPNTETLSVGLGKFGFSAELTPDNLTYKFGVC